MLEKNKIYCCDVLEGLKQLDDESVDIIITSPPYNKGVNKPNGTILVNIAYNGDTNNDNMPEDEYEQWQIDILNECYRVLKKDGSMFYNHKNRILHGKGEIITPYQWLLKSKFKIRQEIIWDRKSTPNISPARYFPCTELIFWLTKSKRPKFDRKKDAQFRKEVWSFRFDVNTEHPAPFPEKLPDNILYCIAGEYDYRPLVLDPFLGSGTVAVSAIKHNCDYIGFEKFPIYVDMAEKRINNFLQI